MKIPEKQYFSLLIEASNAEKEAVKICNHINNDSRKVISNTIPQPTAYTSMAHQIVNFLNDKTDANLSSEEKIMFAERMIAAIKRQEKNMKEFAKLSRYDRESYL